MEPKARTVEVPKAGAKHGRRLAHMLVHVAEWGRFNPDGFYVYVFWGEGDRALYVGLSRNIFRRLGEHFADREKAAAITGVSVVKCDDEQTMKDMEKALIGLVDPEWNVALKVVI